MFFAECQSPCIFFFSLKIFFPWSSNNSQLLKVQECPVYSSVFVFNLVLGGKVAEERPLRLPFLRPGQGKLASAFCKRCNIRRIIPQKHKAEKSALPLSVGIFPARPLPSPQMDPTLSLDLVGEQEGPSFLLSGLPVVCCCRRASLSSRGAGGSQAQLMTTHFLKLFSGRFRCDLGRSEFFFLFLPWLALKQQLWLQSSLQQHSFLVPRFGLWSWEPDGLLIKTR